MFRAQGQDAVILTHNIDSRVHHTAGAAQSGTVSSRELMQMSHASSEGRSMLRKRRKHSRRQQIAWLQLFRKELGNEKLDVKVEKLKDENVASMITLSEESRRMQEMMKMYGMGGMDASMFGRPGTLVLNANHPLVQYVQAHKDEENTRYLL